MRKRFLRAMKWAGFLLLPLIIYVQAHVARVAFMPHPLVEAVPRSDLALDTVISGSLHIHTTESDGRDDIDAVAEAAARAGLDFIVIADHNVEPPRPKRSHGVLVVPGVELSTSDGHVLAVGATRCAEWGLRQEDPIGSARYSGGMVVLAHPLSLGIPWTGSFEEADGMEVVSGNSLLRETLAQPVRRLLPALVSLPGSRKVAVLSIHHRPDDAFERWEEHPELVGVCGHDVHGHFEGYVGPFSAMQLRIRLDEPLPSDPDDAVAALLESLGEGRVWCTLGGVADPSGFEFVASEDPASVRATLSYESWPRRARPRVVVFHEGEEVARGAFEAIIEEAEPGRYRAEVYLEVPWIWSHREFLWIFTNNLLIE